MFTDTFVVGAAHCKRTPRQRATFPDISVAPPHILAVRRLRRSSFSLKAKDFGRFRNGH